MQTVRQHIEKIRHRLGPRPRIVDSSLSRKQRVKRPEWLDDADELSALYRDQEQLLRQGEIGWAHIVQANSMLFEPGKDDLPAAAVYSLDTFFDGRVETLGNVAHQLFSLKDYEYEDPEIDRFAEVITGEVEKLFHVKLPQSVFGELPEVRYTSVLIHRNLLPTKELTLSWFPVFVAPDVTTATQVVSWRYWPKLLVEIWRAVQ